MSIGMLIKEQWISWDEYMSLRLATKYAPCEFPHMLTKDQWNSLDVSMSFGLAQPYTNLVNVHRYVEEGTVEWLECV